MSTITDQITQRILTAPGADFEGLDTGIPGITLTYLGQAWHLQQALYGTADDYERTPVARLLTTRPHSQYVLTRNLPRDPSETDLSAAVEEIIAQTRKQLDTWSAEIRQETEDALHAVRTADRHDLPAVIGWAHTRYDVSLDMLRETLLTRDLGAYNTDPEGTVESYLKAALRDLRGDSYTGLTQDEGKAEKAREIIRGNRERARRKLLAEVEERAQKASEDQAVYQDSLRRRDEAIRAAISQGVSMYRIAKHVGITQQAVRDIRDRG
jgi:hypothetical protein